VKRIRNFLDNMTVGAQALIELRDYCVHSSQSHRRQEVLFFSLFSFLLPSSRLYPWVSTTSTFSYHHIVVFIRQQQQQQEGVRGEKKEGKRTYRKSTFKNQQNVIRLLNFHLDGHFSAPHTQLLSSIAAAAETFFSLSCVCVYEKMTFSSGSTEISEITSLS
jgi:hypothetical protein